MTQKKCPHCKVIKDESAYYTKVGKNIGIGYYCKDCRKEIDRISYNRRLQERTEKRLQKLYKVSYWVYKKLYQAQEGKCAICDRESVSCLPYDTEGRALVCNDCKNFLNKTRDAKYMKRYKAYLKLSKTVSDA